MLVRSLMGKLAGSYRKMSIRRIISLSFTAVAVVGILFIGSSLVLRYSAATQQLQADASQKVLEQVKQSIDSHLRRMMRVSDTVYYRIVKNSDLTYGIASDGLSLLYEENRDDLVSIAVFDSRGGLVASTPLSSLKASARANRQPWFSSALDQIENIHFSTPHVQNLFESADNQYKWVVSISRQVELTRSGTTESGVLLVDMNFSGIEQICRNAQLTGDAYLYIVDRNGEIIYHPRQQLIYANLLQENNLEASQLADGVHWEEFEGVRRQISVKTVGYTGWKLIGVAPVKGLHASTGQLILFVISVFLFSIFLLIFINAWLSAYITEPILELDRAVNDIQKLGQLPPVSDSGCYEVRRLEHSIRSMVSTLRHLMDDIIAQEQDKRRSELEVLQSQINPHFLYNTLDSVIWLTESGRYDDAIQMVTSLGRLFRISLSRGNSIIPLSDELEHASHYMTIQKIRYKNKFSFAISSDPDTEGLYSLKLIVQPILENAIYHGMAAADDDGEISIHVWRNGDDLFIDVQDNGLGMPQEVVDGLLDERKPLPRSKGSGIGVRNVHRRLQLTFGADYGLELHSEPDEGTLVRIHLPVLTKERLATDTKEAEV